MNQSQASNISKQLILDYEQCCQNQNLYIPKINEICKIPYEERTDKDINELYNQIKQTQYFQRYDKLGQHRLVKKALRFVKIVKFKQLWTLFEANSIGNYFYVLIRGKIGVFIPRTYEQQELIKQRYSNLNDLDPHKKLQQTQLIGQFNMQKKQLEQQFESYNLSRLIALELENQAKRKKSKFYQPSQSKLSMTIKINNIQRPSIENSLSQSSLLDEQLLELTPSSNRYSRKNTNQQFLNVAQYRQKIKSIDLEEPLNEYSGTPKNYSPPKTPFSQRLTQKFQQDALKNTFSELIRIEKQKNNDLLEQSIEEDSSESPTLPPENQNTKNSIPSQPNIQQQQLKQLTKSQQIFPQKFSIPNNNSHNNSQQGTPKNNLYNTVDSPYNNNTNQKQNNNTSIKDFERQSLSKSQQVEQNIEQIQQQMMEKSKGLLENLTESDIKQAKKQLFLPDDLSPNLYPDEPELNANTVYKGIEDLLIKSFQVAYIKEGYSFGELALIFDKARAASCIALEDSEILVLDKKNFQLTLKKSEMEKIHENMRFIYNHVLFQDFDRLACCMIYQNSQELTLPKNAYLFQENDFADSIYLIKQGEFVIEKTFIEDLQPYQQKQSSKQSNQSQNNNNINNITNNRKRNHQNSKQIQEPISKKVKQKKLSKLKQYRVCIQGQGTIIGEENYFNKDDTRKYSLKCESQQGIVIRITYNEFLTRILSNNQAKDYMEKQSKKKMSILNQHFSTIRQQITYLYSQDKNNPEDQLKETSHENQVIKNFVSNPTVFKKIKQQKKGRQLKEIILKKQEIQDQQFKQQVQKYNQQQQQIQQYQDITSPNTTLFPQQQQQQLFSPRQSFPLDLALEKNVEEVEKRNKKLQNLHSQIPFRCLNQKKINIQLTNIALDERKNKNKKQQNNSHIHSNSKNYIIDKINPELFYMKKFVEKDDLLKRRMEAQVKKQIQTMEFEEIQITSQTERSSKTNSNNNKDEDHQPLFQKKTKKKCALACEIQQFIDEELYKKQEKQFMESIRRLKQQQKDLNMDNSFQQEKSQLLKSKNSMKSNSHMTDIFNKVINQKEFIQSSPDKYHSRKQENEEQIKQQFSQDFKELSKSPIHNRIKEIGLQKHKSEQIQNYSQKHFQIKPQSTLSRLASQITSNTINTNNNPGELQKISEFANNSTQNEEKWISQKLRQQSQIESYQLNPSYSSSNIISPIKKKNKFYTSVENSQISQEIKPFQLNMSRNQSNIDLSITNQSPIKSNNNNQNQNFPTIINSYKKPKIITGFTTRQNSQVNIIGGSTEPTYRNLSNINNVQNNTPQITSVRILSTPKKSFTLNLKQSQQQQQQQQPQLKNSFRKYQNIKP